MNILFLLLFWSLWFLNFSTRTVLSPLLPIFEKELQISHALAGSIFLLGLLPIEWVKVVIEYAQNPLWARGS